MVLTAGILSLISAGSNGAKLSTTSASGGTAPYTQQWYRSTTDASFTPGAGNIIPNATGLILNDGGLIPNTTYFYKVVYTDATTSTVESAAFTMTTLPASQSMNQLAMSAILGQTDLQQGPKNVVAAQVDASQSTPLYPGQPIKFVNSPYGIPTIVSAGTDMPNGYIVYDQKSPSFTAGMRCEIARTQTCIWLYSTAAIVRGSMVILDPNIASGVRQAEGNSGLPIIGEAFDQATAGGQLFRVILNVPSNMYDSQGGNLFQGVWDASGGTFPTTDQFGNPIVAGQYWIISVAGDLPESLDLVDTQHVDVGDQITALVDNPGQDPAKWAINSSAPGLVSFNGRTTPAAVPMADDYDVSDVTDAASLDSPAFTGTPTAPTPPPGTNTTQIVTAEFVQSAISSYTFPISYVFAPGDTGTYTPSDPSVKYISIQAWGGGGGGSASIANSFTPTQYGTDGTETTLINSGEGINITLGGGKGGTTAKGEGGALSVAGIPASNPGSAANGQSGNESGGAFLAGFSDPLRINLYFPGGAGGAGIFAGGGTSDVDPDKCRGVAGTGSGGSGAPIAIDTDTQTLVNAGLGGGGGAWINNLILLPITIDYVVGDKGVGGTGGTGGTDGGDGDAGGLVITEWF